MEPWGLSARPAPHDSRAAPQSSTDPARSATHRGPHSSDRLIPAIISRRRERRHKEADKLSRKRHQEAPQDSNPDVGLPDRALLRTSPAGKFPTTAVAAGAISSLPEPGAWEPALGRAAVRESHAAGGLGPLEGAPLQAGAQRKVQGAWLGGDAEDLIGRETVCRVPRDSSPGTSVRIQCGSK